MRPLQAIINQGKLMRPRIICHMVSSIDGRLLADRWTPPAAGSSTDIVHRTYEQVAARFEADGWIVGRRTMENFAQGAARAPRAVSGDLRGITLRTARGATLPWPSIRMASCTMSGTMPAAITSWRFWVDLHRERYCWRMCRSP
jgi:hypothetical protein